VPDVDLDTYLYAQQDAATTIPANLITATRDIDVESMALWGIADGDELSMGIAITLADEADAAEVYALIVAQKDSWKLLSGNVIYIVQGGGSGAQALKTAISNNRFKPYDDQEALKAVSVLPASGTTKLATTAIAKPSEGLISLLTRELNAESLTMINTALKLVNLKVVAAGLYSPRHIDIAKVVTAFEQNNIARLDVGVLALVKSGLPGLVVEPIVKRFLTDNGFTEKDMGGITVYQQSIDNGSGETTELLIRVEGNQLFAAVSGQASYAETLLASVKL